MTTNIKGENNKVRNNQKVGILSPSIELVNNSSQCSSWQLIEFEVFERIILSFLIIALIYWGLGKMFRKKRVARYNEEKEGRNQIQKATKDARGLDETGVDNFRLNNRH